MKKSLLVLSFILSANAFAGSIDYLAQQDAEYFAHPSMTGKIGVSSAFYNPAGTVFLEDGTYVQLNTQTIDKEYEMDTKFQGTGHLKDSRVPEKGFGNHKSDHPSALVPSVQLVFKEGDRSYFFHGGAAAGGGDVKYNNGISAFELISDLGIELGFREQAAKVLDKDPRFSHLTPKQKEELKKQINVEYLGGSTVRGSSYYFNTNFGMAQKINNHFSVAGGIRLMYITRQLEGTAHYNLESGIIGNNEKGPVNVNIDAERTGFGVGGFVGFNYQPNEKLNVGFKYESEIELNLKADGRVKTTSKNKVFEYKDPKTGASICDGINGKLEKHPVISEWLVDDRRNLPAVASLGLAYQLNDKVTLLTAGNYYFIKDANRNGVYDNYDNGYEVSFGVDYKLNDKYTLMAGYQYTNTGANDKTVKDTDYALDADMYGVGVKYTPDDTKEFVVSYAYVDYKDGTSYRNIDGNRVDMTTYKKKVQAVSLSAAFKF